MRILFVAQHPMHFSRTSDDDDEDQVSCRKYISCCCVHKNFLVKEKQKSIKCRVSPEGSKIKAKVSNKMNQNFV